MVIFTFKLNGYCRLNTNDIKRFFMIVFKFYCFTSSNIYIECEFKIRLLECYS